MAKEIFVIGYGSLIWDLDDLAACVTGPWDMNGGPEMPLEFSRISPRRKRALALVTDPRGNHCPTHAIKSVRTSVAEAVKDLARRERTQADWIGFVDRASGTRQTRNDAIAHSVARWCEEKDASGAVWTDLDANFDGFTVKRAILYLRELEGESLEAAVEYINCAPVATDTPLRRALAKDPWWQALSQRGFR